MTEADIQAEFYHHARLIGLACVLEHCTPVGRLDIAVLNDARDRLLVIVECKRRESFSPGQIARYKSIGVPVYGLHKFDRAEGLAKQLKRTLAAAVGVALEDVAKMERVKKRRSKQWRKDPEQLRRFVWDEDLNLRN